MRLLLTRPLATSPASLGRIDGLLRPAAPARSEPDAGDREPTPPRGWKRGWLLALWVLISLMSAAPTYLHYLAERQPIPWSRLLSEVAGWYLWILFFPAILSAARRFPLEWQRWRKSATIHVLIGSLVAVAYALLVLVKNQAIFYLATGDADPHLLSFLPGYLFGGFQIYFLVYWMLLAAVHAVDYYGKYRERELRALELEARLSRAHLQVLKMQLDPHFLFNTLNAISVLLYSNPGTADRMIGLLSDFLRVSLKSSNQQEVPLAREIEFLEHYLEIERTRFAERLKVDLEVEPGTLDAAVPSLMLQPLVENSIRHGMEGESGRLEVSVEARRVDGDRLEIRVTDNGPGFPEPVEVALEQGIGLSNTYARLRKLYGSGHLFELSNGEEGGAIARALIPLRRIAHGATADEPAIEETV